MKTQNESAEQLCTLGKIITFNGQGCSGKSTQSKCLAKSDETKYKCCHSYKLRSCFEKKFYNSELLKSKDTCIKYLDGSGTCKPLYQVEVLGIPTLAWLTAHFYKEIKPRMLKGSIVVLDHYLGDYYADMLTGVDIEKFRSFVREHLAIPDFDQGIHFYLYIDYQTYQNRWRKREERKPPQERTEPPVTPEIFEDRHGRYQELCDKGCLKCIDATGTSKEKVQERVAEVIRKKFPQ